MRKVQFFVLVLSFFVAQSLKADDRFGSIGQYSIEGNYQFGRIIPHNSKFKAPVTSYTHAMEIGFYKQTLGDKAWQRKLHYPEFGGSFTFTYNGDQKIFGNAYIFLMYAKFWIVRSRIVDFYVRAATGLAFVPTHFDPIKNPENDAIGSTLNSADQLRFGLDFKPDPHLQVLLGVTLTHYSNAASQLPNLGVNVPALTVGIRYFPKVSGDMKYNRDRIPKPVNKNEMLVKLSIATNEMNVFGGPKYPTYIGTIQYARFTSVANKVLAGTSFEYSQGDHDFLVIQEIETKYGVRASSIKFSIYAGDEILMGKVGLSFAVGAYLFNPLKVTPVYVKLGLNYYFASAGKKKTTKFFVSANLKSHFLVAQYYELGTGVAFW
jgi:hypothetical protein